MSDIFTIALVQFDIKWHHIDHNLKTIENCINSLKNPVDLIILPEMFTTGFTMQPEQFSLNDQERIIFWMKAVSDKSNAALAGSIPFRAGESYYNRLFFISPDAETIFYDKRHLFSMGDENKHYLPGRDRKIILFRGIKIMPLICYDLRFPVWSRNDKNFDLLIYVANWPDARMNAWEILLQARAVENQCFVAGVNRIGTDGQNIGYSGGSMVVSAEGNKLIKLNNKEKISVIKLDMGQMHEYRSKFPVLNDRDTYTFQ